MNLSWTVLTDGRQHYIEEALPSWINYFDKIIDKKFIIDDSGDREYREWLQKTFPSFKIIPVGPDRCGYSLAMKKVFNTIKTYSCDYCLHLEDDFILHKPFDITKVVEIMEANKRVAQVSLMRQPWYHNEHEHGGVIEAIQAHTPQAKFTDRNTNGIHWVEHSAFWTCNPSVLPNWITNFEWPSGDWSESRFGKEVFKKRKTVGVFGSKQDWPYVEHIGRERYGNKY